MEQIKRKNENEELIQDDNNIIENSDEVSYLEKKKRKIAENSKDEQDDSAINSATSPDEDETNDGSSVENNGSDQNSTFKKSFSRKNSRYEKLVKYFNESSKTWSVGEKIKFLRQLSDKDYSKTFTGNEFNFKIQPYSLNHNNGTAWYHEFIKATTEEEKFNPNNSSNWPTYKGTPYKQIYEASDESEKDEIKFTEEQKTLYTEVLSHLNEQPFTVDMLMGPAGTGKTTALRQFLNDPSLRFIYVAIQKKTYQNPRQEWNLSKDQTYTLFKLIWEIFGFAYEFNEEIEPFMKNITTIEPTLFRQLNLLNFDISIKCLDKICDTTINNADDSATTKPKKKVVICLDEFSSVTSNEIHLLITVLKYYISSKPEGFISIVLLLSGHCFHIEPINVPKQKNFDVEKIRQLLKSSDFYSFETIPDNCKDIISLVDYAHFFKSQMRNDDEGHQQFLIDMINAENWKQTIYNHYGEQTVSNRTIEYKYPFGALKNMPSFPTEMHSALVDYFGSSQTVAMNGGNLIDLDAFGNYFQDVTSWLDQYSADFTKFLFFAYTNIMAHFINLSLYHSIRKEFENFMSCNSDAEFSKKLSTLRPRLAPIYVKDIEPDKPRTISNGDEYLPFLPLVIGLQYEILASINQFEKGQLVTLIHYDDSDKDIKYVIVMGWKKNFYCLQAYPFYMNWFYTTKKEFDRSSDRPLIGFPMKLAVGNTIHSVAGSAVKKDLYGSINCTSRGVASVLLSRQSAEHNVSGLDVSNK